MADEQGEHPKDSGSSKTINGKASETGATLSKQDTENIIDGLTKRLAGNNGGLPTDPTKTAN